MNDVQKLALEICNSRQDLSDEQKERISKLLINSTNLGDIPTPSTSFHGSPEKELSDKEKMEVSKRLSADLEDLRLSRRFSKNRKIFGSDMCLNLGEMKREKRWPAPSTVLAAFGKKSDKQNISRRLSDIVASKSNVDGVNGYVPNQHSVKYVTKDNVGLTDLKPMDLNKLNSEVTIPNGNAYSTLSSNNSKVVSSADRSFKYYTLSDVYRDLTLMRRTVSACLKPENRENGIVTRGVNRSNVEIKINKPSNNPSPVSENATELEPLQNQFFTGSNQANKCDISNNSDVVFPTKFPEQKDANDCSKDRVIPTQDKTVLGTKEQSNIIQDKEQSTHISENVAHEDIRPVNKDHVSPNKVSTEANQTQKYHPEKHTSQSVSETNGNHKESKSGIDPKIHCVIDKKGTIPKDKNHIKEEHDLTVRRTIDRNDSDEVNFKTKITSTSVKPECKTSIAKENTYEKYCDNIKKESSVNCDREELVRHLIDKVHPQGSINDLTQSKLKEEYDLCTYVQKRYKTRPNAISTRKYVKLYEHSLSSPPHLVYDNIYEDDEDETELSYCKELNQNNEMITHLSTNNVDGKVHNSRKDTRTFDQPIQKQGQDNHKTHSVKHTNSSVHRGKIRSNVVCRSKLIPKNTTQFRTAINRQNKTNKISTKETSEQNAKFPNGISINVNKTKHSELQNGFVRNNRFGNRVGSAHANSQNIPANKYNQDTNITKQQTQSSFDHSSTNGIISAKRFSKPKTSSQKITRPKENIIKTSTSLDNVNDKKCKYCHRHHSCKRNKGIDLRTLKNSSLSHDNNRVYSGHVNNSLNCDSSQNRYTDDDKLCKQNNEMPNETNKANQKKENNICFNTCFLTIITPNTQSLDASNLDTKVINKKIREHGNTVKHRKLTSSTNLYQHNNMSETDGVKFTTNESENEDFKREYDVPKENNRDLHDASDDEDSVFDDKIDDEININDNDGDDKEKRRKSVMISRNSGKSRTDITLSSALSRQTPYSEFDYQEKEIATDVISTILDDVIDFVWQANVSKFKHHVCKTNDLLGDETVGCIVLVNEEHQTPVSFTCNILNPYSFPATVDKYEILIGNIVQVHISEQYDLRGCSVKIAVPFSKTNMRFFHEPVLKTYDTNHNSWTSVDSFENIYFDENDSDLSVLETNIQPENIYVVVARPTTEYLTFNDNLVEYDSRIDSDVTVASPIGSRVKTTAVDVKFMVHPIGADLIASTRESSDDDTHSLVGASPIIFVEQSEKNPQPIFITLPCERPGMNALKSRLSSAPSPEDSGYYTQSRLSKMNDFVETWMETESHLIRIGGCDRVKCQLMTFRDVSEDNKINFCIHEKKTICLVVETRKEATRPNIQRIARHLLKVIEYQRVVVSVMQNKDEIHDLTVTCDLRTRYATRMRQRLAQNYEISSKFASLKEGDIVSLNLRGNLTSIGKRFHIFRFHGSQTVRVNWNLQVVDKYSQKTLDYYYGFVQLLNLKFSESKLDKQYQIDGHDWNVLLEIPVRLPKPQIGSIPPPIKTKLSVVEEGPVTLQFLTTIASCLASQWNIVAKSLQISNARLQSLRRENRNNDMKLVKDLLFTWLKNMPHAKDKAIILVDLLRKCGKHEIANKLEQGHQIYVNEKARRANEQDIDKILNTVIKSGYLITKWKDLASELGLTLDIINHLHSSGNSDQERCLNMLMKWTSEKRQNWIRYLARCTRRVGCKYVADHLLSIVVKQNQLK